MSEAVSERVFLRLMPGEEKERAEGKTGEGVKGNGEIMPAIESKGILFRYSDPPIEALRDITFRIEQGEFSVVMGPNGSGKSTLLKLMMGLLGAPEKGEIRVMGHLPYREPEAVQRAVGYVPQTESVNYNMPLRVRDVVAMGVQLRNPRLAGRMLMMRVKKALGFLEIERLIDRPFHALSGGERQRVLIARAVAMDPKILLLDEPFSAMDVHSQEITIDFLSRLSRDYRITVLAVVHNVNPLVHHIDNILLLNRRMIAFGPPNKVLTREILREAYGISVPILLCPEGYCHPMLGDAHGGGRRR